jgi:GWxTD domain-containing protein
MVWPLVASGQITAPTLSDNSTQDIRPRRCFNAQNSKNSRRAKKALADLPSSYRFWLAEDAAYIISPEERCAYLQLESDAERDQFIEQFWYRRAANPESLENDFQQEHYRRIIFANCNFGTDISGWKTDRGRIYIVYGPPDTIVLHPAGDPTQSSPENSESVAFSWERWHFTYVEGVGRDVNLDFVDPTGSGDYRLRMSPEDQNGLIFYPYHDTGPALVDLNEIQAYIGAQQPPVPRYKDLEAIVVSRIIRNQLRFSYQTRFVRATHASTMATIVVDLPEGQSSATTPDSNPNRTYEIFGRITTPSGYVASTFERTVEVDEHEHRREDPNREETIPLKPGTYLLALVVKTIAAGETGVSYTELEVPTFDEAGQE